MPFFEKSMPIRPPHHDDSSDILPPGKMRPEDGDSLITGLTRSLQRRVLGLRVLGRLRDIAAKRQTLPPPPSPPKKLD